MAGIKISELPEATCVIGDELVAIVQDSTTKFVAASAIGATGDSTISSVIAGCGLQGGGSYGAVTLHMDANCLQKYDGTTSHVRSTSACWEGTFTTVQSNSSNWDQSTCPGIDCTGVVSTIGGGDGIDVTGTVSTKAVAVDSTVVRTTGAQSIGGNKTFTAATTHCNNVLACCNVTVGGSLYAGSGVTSISANMVHVSQLHASSLPTSDPGVPGVVWNDAGTLKISI